MTDTSMPWLQVLTECARWVIAAGLLFSCLTDLRYRIVCNEICLAVVAAASVIAVTRGLPSSVGWIAYGVVFLLVLATTLAGTMGGGDAKLAVALLPSLTAMGCLQFVVVTCLAGGAIGAAVLIASWVLRRRSAGPRPIRSFDRGGAVRQWIRHETARLRRGRSIPYVPAITVGWFAAAHA